ncbi:MAG: hypothetical protein F6K41_24175 [Symploca sp. SIO3E6]|nr:hypothetical protein [Caldora sp. SIO3E6]
MPQCYQEISIMGIYKLFDSITEYISEAVVRIFGPNDDAYPATGLQPFSDDPYKPRRADW